MPDYSTSVATAQDASVGAAANFASRPDARNIDGKVCHTRVAYTLLGTEVATEKVKLCHLPKGARFLPGLSKVTPSADGGTIVLDIGTLGDPDAFADGIAVSSTTPVLFDSGTIPIASTVDKAVGEGTLLSSSRDPATDNAVYALFMATTSTTAAVVLYFDLYWCIP